MKKLLNKQDLQYMLLAFLAAVVLWGFVVYEQNTQTVQDFSSVSVELRGLDVLEERGLTIISGQNTKITVRVQGLYSQIAYFDVNETTASVDVSYITEPGTYRVSRISVSLPESSNGVSMRNVELISTRPTQFEVVVDRVVEKEVPLRADVVGTAAEGYVYDTPVFNQETILVSGPESVVETIEYAIFPIEIEGIDEDYEFTGDVHFVTEDHTVVTKDLLRYSSSELLVVLPVHKYAIVPLRVSLASGAGLTEDMVNVTISPATVQIVGTRAAVDAVSSIDIGTIPLSTITLEDTRTMGVPVPENVKIVGGTQSVEVSVTVKNVVQRNITIDNIDLVVSNGENWTVEQQTASITVRVRGEAGALNALTGDDFIVSTVVDAQALGEGTHTRDVVVRMRKSGQFVLLDQLAQVTIAITENLPPDDPTDEPEVEVTP